MTRSQLLIRLPEDLKAALVARAQSEGKPLNQWVQDALIAALDSSLIAGDSSPDSTAAITPDSTVIAALIAQQLSPLVARIEMLEK